MLTFLSDSVLCVLPYIKDALYSLWQGFGAWTMTGAMFLFWCFAVFVTAYAVFPKLREQLRGAYAFHQHYSFRGAWHAAGQQQSWKKRIGDRYFSVLHWLLPDINPSILTTLRLPFAILAAYFLWAEDYGMAWWSALAVDVTDHGDGVLARFHKRENDFGRLYDPLKDAAGRWSLFLALYAVTGAGSAVFIALIVYRDEFVGFLRQLAGTMNVVMDARPSGKNKAVVQWICTDIMYGLIWAFGPTTIVTWINTIIMGAMTFITVRSGFEYGTAPDSAKMLREGFAQGDVHTGTPSYMTPQSPDAALPATAPGSGIPAK